MPAASQPGVKVPRRSTTPPFMTNETRSTTRDVLERRAGNRDDVGIIARLQRADLHRPSRAAARR